jgi:small subunit ribosomal protein S17
MRMAERGVRKQLTGVVVGNRMDKTAKVLVRRLKKHRTYKKYVKGHKTYMVHDPKNACQIGDKVKIIESRPVSKMKRWQVIELLEGGVKDVVDRVIDERSEPGNDSDSNEAESG